MTAGVELPNTGCDGVAAGLELKANIDEDDGALADEPNIGVVLEPVAELEDPPNIKVGVEEELNEEPNTGVGFGDCQFEPNTAEVVVLLELAEFVKEGEEPS